MDNIIIKPTNALTDTEIDMVYGLLNECFGYYEDHIYDLEEYILLYFGGENNQEIVGLIQITQHLDLTCVCTHPKYRRRGYANQLMEQAIKFTHKNCLESNKPHILKLEVLENNEIAIKFYIKHGFRIEYTDEYTMPDGKIEKSLIMIRS